MFAPNARPILHALVVAALLSTFHPAPAEAQGSLSAADKAFIAKAFQSSNYEIEAAKLSAWMAIDPQIKSYGEMMDQDHRHFASQLASVVRAEDSTLVLPSDVDPQGQAMLSALRNAGKGFDATYRDQMLSTHTDALQVFRTYLASTDANPRIRAVVQSAVQMDQAHLDRAKELLPKEGSSP